MISNMSTDYEIFPRSIRASRDGSVRIGTYTNFEWTWAPTCASYESKRSKLTYPYVTALTMKSAIKNDDENVRKCSIKPPTTCKRTFLQMHLEIAVYIIAQFANRAIEESLSYRFTELFLHAKRQEVRLLLIEFNKVALPAQCAVFRKM